jgi:hypothetical protein
MEKKTIKWTDVKPKYTPTEEEKEFYRKVLEKNNANSFKTIHTLVSSLRNKKP